MTNTITADAVALQERDEFRPDGWLKVIAPAKVNLHLAIGAKRADGYHEAATVMHALNLHDVVYLRRSMPDEQPAGCRAGSGRVVPTVHMVAGDPSIVLPELSSADNLAARAVVVLADALQLPEDATNLQIRIEKSIPAQAGLGGGSTNAAAALVGAARLWSLPADDPAIEQVAKTLGADVAFFLRGGCAYLEGTGDTFVHALQPSKQAVALVKPEGGVSTAQAYRQFDERPTYADDDLAADVRQALAADDVQLYNNLAAASEIIMPQLADAREWLAGQEGVCGSLLCGSGAATFALCDDFSAACRVVAAARKRGWWARTSSLGSARVMVSSFTGGVSA